MAEKIILDTDPGIDDAMAIFFALQAQEIDVLGFTTVFGNVPVTMAAQNMLRLCDIAQVDLPVCQGVAMPWVGPESTYAHFVHGDNGFGDIALQAPRHQLDQRHAAQFIIETCKANPGEVSLVAIGPLGNLALALHLEPDLPKYVKQVLIMGGAAFVPGNVTPLAEANIWNDPHAAKKVFAADWSVKMFGLDVTTSVHFDPDFTARLAACNPRFGGFVQAAAEFYMDFYSQGSDTRFCCFHDSFPLAYLLQPDLFTFTSGNANVGVAELDRGQTSIAANNRTPSPLWLSQPEVAAATSVDGQALTELLLTTYAR